MHVTTHDNSDKVQRGILHLLGLCLLLLLVTACAGDGDGLDENGNPIEEVEEPMPMPVPPMPTPPMAPPPMVPPMPVAPTFGDIQETILIPFCFCHVGAGAPLGLVLNTTATYDLLVNVASGQRPELFRVEPDNPDDSYLIHKLEGGPDIVGFRMPAVELGAPSHLSPELIDMVREWIAAGALDN